MGSTGRQSTVGFLVVTGRKRIGGAIERYSSPQRRAPARVISAMAEAEALVAWGDYISPLSDRIDMIRHTILGNAEERHWSAAPTVRKQGRGR